eukprot:3789962-Rhodomonas_salina.3
MACSTEKTTSTECLKLCFSEPVWDESTNRRPRDAAMSMGSLRVGNASENAPWIQLSATA